MGKERIGNPGAGGKDAVKLTQAEEDIEMELRYCHSIVDPHIKVFCEPWRSGKFLKIYVTNESRRQTETIDVNSNPSWKPISLSTREIVGKDTRLRIELFNRKSDGTDVLKGEIETSVGELEQLHKQREPAKLAPPGGSFKLFGKRKLFVDKFKWKGQ